MAAPPARSRRCGEGSARPVVSAPFLITPSFVLAIFLAFAVVGATIASAAQLISIETMGKARLRAAHGASLIGVLAVMAALGAVSEGAATVLGVSLIQISALAGLGLSLAAIAAMAMERGWARLTPAPLAMLGLLVASGAPFAA